MEKRGPRIRKRFLTILLSFVMVATYMPTAFFVYAQDNESKPQLTNEENVAEETQNEETSTEESLQDEEDQDTQNVDDPDNDDLQDEIIDEDEDLVDDEPQAKAPKRGGDSDGEDNTLKDAGEGDLTITSGGFNLRDDGTYVMTESLNVMIPIAYGQQPFERVLVVEIPEYGVAFNEAELPKPNDKVLDTHLINAHTFAMRIKAGVEGNNLLHIKPVALTNDEAEYLMDHYNEVNSRIAVTEYEYDGDLENVQTAGTPLRTVVAKDPDSEVSWEGKPYFNSEAGVSATHTYKVAVTPISDDVSPLTDIQLEKVGTASGNSYGLMTNWMNGEPRFALPEAYTDSGSLMEILSIKIYAPDDRVYLKKISNTEQVATNVYSRDLAPADFHQEWGNWTVSEAKTDANGTYYEITPPSGTRLFNINSWQFTKDEGKIKRSTDKTAFYAGMVLTWQLKDPNAPLDAGQDYQAANTVITYKLPGEDAKTTETDGSNGIKGPEIKTYEVKTRDPITYYSCDGTYSPAYLNSPYRRWNYDATDEKYNVYSGSIARGELFTSYLNDSYISGGVHYLPKYTGAVTQTYVFPYQIQPITILMGETYQASKDVSKKSKLRSITYTTYENSETVVTLSQSIIDDVNSNIVANKDTILNTALPSDVHIKELKIEWDELATEIRWSSRYGDRDVNHYNSTALTKFDYKVNSTKDYTDADQVMYLDSGIIWAQVKYSETYDHSIEGAPEDKTPGNVRGTVGERAGIIKPQSFWFRIVQPIDPLLTSYGTDDRASRSDLPIEYMDDGKKAVGKIGFYVGKYGERQDIIKNPVINLSVSQKKQSYDGWSNWGTGYVRRTLSGISDEQLLAYFTGEFTATEKLVGWTFEYTAKNRDGDEKSYTYKVEQSGAIQLPLDDGYSFTSLKMRYDGDFDLSHASETDDTMYFWLMQDIKMKRLTTNPFTGEEIKCDPDFSYVALTITGDASWDNCVCEEHDHDYKNHGKTQKMGVVMTNNLYPNPLRIALYNLREASYKEATSLTTTDVVPMRQGESKSADFKLVSTFTALKPKHVDSGVYSRPPFGTSGFPWGEVHEAVYVEITDRQFNPDWSTTKFMGYAADSDKVINEFVTTSDGKRFIKLRLADGVIKRNKGTTDNTTGTVTDALTIGLKSIVGTSSGLHNPIGEIYYDASHLLEMYDAPEKTGYDYDRTKYIFEDSAVEDEYGLSDTAVTGRKLFKSDGSAFTVNVAASSQSLQDLAPGKDEFYDEETRTITYYPGEEEKLNALLTLMSAGDAGSASIYDMEAYVVLPRKDKEIGGKTSEINLYLRDENSVKPLTANDDLGAEITYTMDTDPNQSSTYVAASEINDWSKVTGLKVHIAEMEPQKSTNLQLDLRSDEKETLDVIKAYAGGTHRFKTSPDGDYTSNGSLPVCTWEYENIPVASGSGLVFWDVYDENGVRTLKSEGEYRDGETPIKGVKLALYDKNGTKIDEAETDKDGKFTLKTYKNEADQYIVIENPEVTDGSTVKLTKQSESEPSSSGIDSDFGRDTNKLTLGELPARGISNISAGFIKMPEIEKPDDVSMNVGSDKDLTVLINEFISNTTYDDSNVLTNGDYTIEFSGYDETLVTLTEPSLEKESNTQLKAVPTITSKNKLGTTTVTVTITNALGDKVSKTFNITVNKLELHTDNYSGEYDGASHKGDAYITLNGVDKVTDAEIEYSTDDGVTWKTKEPTAKDVDDTCTVKVKATYEDYGTVYGEYALTVTPKELTVVTNSDEKVYDGAALTADGTLSGLVEGETATLNTTGTITNVGEADNTYEIDWGTAKESNYVVASETIGKLKVTKAPLAIKTESASKVYDGDPLTAAGELTGLVNGETAKFTVTGSQTEVGTSDNTYSLEWNGTAKESNYEIASEVIGTLTVTENADEIVVTTTGGTFTYDGQTHGATVAVSTLPKGYTVETATSDASAKDVTKAPVEAKCDHLKIVNKDGKDVTDKLNLKFNNGELVINPKTLNVVTESASKTYDGKELTAPGSISGFAEVDGVAETATFKVTGSRTDAGESDNTYSIKWDGTAKESNYKVEESLGTLSIGRKAARVIADDKSKVYGSKDPELTATEEGIVEGEHIEYTLKRDEGEDVGTYNITFEYEEKAVKQNFLMRLFKESKTANMGNYDVEFVDGEFTITQAELKVTTPSAEKEYDGKPLTAEGSIEGFANDETATFTTTGSQTEVGESQNTYSLKWNGTAKESNYRITEDLGTLKVTAANEEESTEPETSEGTTTTPDNPTNPDNPSTPDKTNKKSVTKTGDDTNLGLWVILMMMSLTSVSAVYAVRRRSYRNK